METMRRSFLLVRQLCLIELLAVDHQNSQCSSAAQQSHDPQVCHEFVTGLAVVGIRDGQLFGVAVHIAVATVLTGVSGVALSIGSGSSNYRVVLMAGSSDFVSYVGIATYRAGVCLAGLP